MKHLILDMGPYTLEVDVEDDVELDEAFMALDVNTGEYLCVYGWLIESVDEIDDAELAYTSAAMATVPPLGASL